MPTIGHILLGVVAPVLIGYVLNKKIPIEILIYFLIGSILPDTYTIIRLFIYPDIVEYISFNITHGFIIWIFWSYVFAVIFRSLFYRISKLNFTKIFFILLSAGWLHLGLDMLTQPTIIIGDFSLSILSFYTEFQILGEQDFIVVFYIFFILIPLTLLIMIIKKENNHVN